MRRCAVSAAAAFSCVVLLAGCGSSESASPKAEFAHGVEQIRSSHGAKALHGQLVRTIANLRRKRPSTARRLAIEGFTWTLQGVDAQIDLIENDSGNLEAAVRDAAKADRYRKRGASLLRSAGRAFGISIGRLKGY